MFVFIKCSWKFRELQRNFKRCLWMFWWVHCSTRLKNSSFEYAYANNFCPYLLRVWKMRVRTKYSVQRSENWLSRKFDNARKNEWNQRKVIKKHSLITLLNNIHFCVFSKSKFVFFFGEAITFFRLAKLIKMKKSRHWTWLTLFFVLTVIEKSLLMFVF